MDVNEGTVVTECFDVEEFDEDLEEVLLFGVEGDVGFEVVDLGGDDAVLGVFGVGLADCLDKVGEVATQVGFC